MINREEPRKRAAAASALEQRKPADPARASKNDEGVETIGQVVANVNGEIIHGKVPRYGHFLIGRSKMCDLRLVPLEVSRHHALIIHSSNGTEIVDLRSRNGTYVDGQRISFHPLGNNAAISIGTCTLRYITDDG